MTLKKILRCIPKKSAIIICIVMFIILYYRITVSVSKAKIMKQKAEIIRDYADAKHDLSTSIKPPSKLVEVNVNGKTSFEGIFIDNQVYVPFEFLKEYYEVHGDWITESPSLEQKKKFFWSHTKLSVLNPNDLQFKSFTYKTTGTYLNFVNTNVANRARVKCISGIYEVPITTQWDVKGYFYPIQIAQYGLSHLSKFYAAKSKPRTKIFHLPQGATGIYDLKINTDRFFVLKVKFKSKLASFDVHFMGSDENEYTLSYVTDDILVERNNKIIRYGLGKNLLRADLTRDLNVDFIKGMSFIEGKKEGATVDMQIKKVFQIIFTAIEVIEEVSLVSQDHKASFLAAADWFITFQDGAGGWKTNVSRHVMTGMKSKPGWYSAMGQGQAISLLCRVYTYTKNKKYIDAALKATHIFNVPASKNGIVAMLFDKIPWYEEYPVTPSLFVLNGFLYSLLGLYDLSKTVSANDAEEADRLFKQGVSSLESLLPLYDNGHGSYYDLRHITVPGHPPNRARWQYHRVHLELLNAMKEITRSKQIAKTLSRWIDYAAGVRSKHN